MMETDSLGVKRSQEQKAKDAANRRRLLVGVLDAAKDTEDLVMLVGMLELDVELEPLVTTSERQRLLDEARARLDSPIEEQLDEVAASQGERH